MTTTSLPLAPLFARLGLRHPVVQGPFGGGLSTPELVAAVTGAGGLGSFGLEGFTPARIAESAAAVRARTAGPFNLNLWVPLPGDDALRLDRTAFDRAVLRLAPIYADLGLDAPRFEEVEANPVPSFAEQVEAVLAAKPAVASFIFGVPPEPMLHALRARGIVTIGTATNLVEGEALAAAGIDAIVASGAEAGGHRAAFLRGTEASLTVSALVPQLADRVGVPVIAAGGIADARGVRAAFALGASAVQVGTGFLASHESGAAEAHKAALVAEGERATILTTAFTGRHARGLVNRFVREAAAHPDDVLPFPWQYLLTRPIRQAAAAAGRSEWMSLWAGQNVTLVRRRGAAEVIDALTT